MSATITRLNELRSQTFKVPSDDIDKIREPSGLNSAIISLSWALKASSFAPVEESQSHAVIPPDAKQAVKDYLARLDDAAFAAASEVKTKYVSPSDPAAQWTGALRGPAFFAYATNYLIDTDNAVIVDVEELYGNVGDGI